MNVSKISKHRKELIRKVTRELELEWGVSSTQGLIPHMFFL